MLEDWYFSNTVKSESEHLCTVKGFTAFFKTVLSVFSVLTQALWFASLPGFLKKKIKLIGFRLCSNCSNIFVVSS